MKPKRKLKRGDKVRYVQRLFGLGSLEDELYGKIGDFIEYDKDDASWAYVGFKGLNTASYVEVIALERI